MSKIVENSVSKYTIVIYLIILVIGTALFSNIQFDNDEAGRLIASSKNGHKPTVVKDPFWTPISIRTGKDLTITFCKLNFIEHSKAPHLTPMFKDFVKMSKCGNGNILVRNLIDVQGQGYDSIYSDSTVPVPIIPTGFVFHESRVGSTLVANLLASDAENMVFSESAPPSIVLMNLRSVSRDRKIEVFRETLLMMCRSTYHKRCFFKFQSITSTMIDIALEAFPEVPWIYLYRSPVETMMSHVGNGKSSGAPCLRSKNNPPQLIKKELMKHYTHLSGASNEAWCAAHLNMLCMHSLEAYEIFGKSSSVEREIMIRGFLLPYESLPGSVVRIVLPLFKIKPSPSWVSAMKYESKLYSKGRDGEKVFTGDSQSKNSGASREVKKWGNAILKPTFTRMMNASLNGLKALVKHNIIVQDELCKGILNSGSAHKSWQLLSKIDS